MVTNNHYNEIALGTMGRWFDNWITWQFSHWYIAIPMSLLELFIIYYLYMMFFRVMRDP